MGSMGTSVSCYCSTMITCHVFIATSLDGFIARRNGDIDWLESVPAEGEDHGFRDFMANVDGLIMGRGTYEKALSFDAWPYSKPVVVLSKRLRQSDVPSALAGKVRISSKEPAAIVQEMAQEAWRRAYVDGGLVIQSFLRVGLIKELTITRIPVLLGSGIPLFGPLPGDQRLIHLETIAFKSGLVQSKYQICR